jgi:hypothetical protein
MAYLENRSRTFQLRQIRHQSMLLNQLTGCDNPPGTGNMNPHLPSVSALDSLEKSQKLLKIKDGGCGSFDNSL